MRRYFMGRKNKTNSFIWRILRKLGLFCAVSIFAAILIFIFAAIVLIVVGDISESWRIVLSFSIASGLFAGIITTSDGGR